MTWTPTPALRRAVTVGGLALLAAAALGRSDLIVFAVPLVLGTLAALTIRPQQAPDASLEVTEPKLSEGDDIAAAVTVSNPDRAAMVAVVSVRAGAGLRLEPGAGRYADVLPPQTQGRVDIRGIAHRWGRHGVGPVTWRAFACEGLLRTATYRLPAAGVSVYPRTELFDSRQELPRPTGMSGIHRSRWPGEGGELAEVRPFASGDRLKRIDWRISLRQRELYVNATLSERDAEIMLVLDVLHDASDDGDSVLDVTVRAAAAITEHYTRQGDRVGLAEFGPGMRRLRAGAGRRHYQVVREWLLDTKVRPGVHVAAERLTSAGHIPFGSTVIMLTPLLDDDSTRAMAGLARSGRQLAMVDTLPAGLEPPSRGPWSPLAARLWRLEREHTIARMRALGVPAATWGGAGSLDGMLAELVRSAHAPRAVRR